MIGVGVNVGVGVGAGVAGAGVNVGRGGEVANGVGLGKTTTEVTSGCGVINRPQPASKAPSITRVEKRCRISAHYTTGPK